MAAKKRIREEYDAGPPLDAAPAGASQLPANISLDQKVDRILVDAERQSSPLNSQHGQVVERFSLSRMIFEADEVPTEDPAGDVGGADLGPAFDDGGGTGEAGDKAPTVPDSPVPQINLDTFAARVARLATNYQTLLDPQTTILLRAQAFIATNYSGKLAQELSAKLQQQYGLTARTLDQRTSDQGSVPLAAGAAADVGGAG